MFKPLDIIASMHFSTAVNYSDISIYKYTYMHTQGRIQDFRKGRFYLSILNRRRRRFPGSETPKAPKAPRGRSVGRDALPTRLGDLGERRELSPRGT